MIKTTILGGGILGITALLATITPFFFLIGVPLAFLISSLLLFRHIALLINAGIEGEEQNRTDTVDEVTDAAD